MVGINNYFCHPVSVISIRKSTRNNYVETNKNYHPSGIFNLAVSSEGKYLLKYKKWTLSGQQNVLLIFRWLLLIEQIEQNYQDIILIISNTTINWFQYRRFGDVIDIILIIIVIIIFIETILQNTIGKIIKYGLLFYTGGLVIL